MFRSSSEKIAVSLTLISNFAVTARVSINKKGVDQKLLSNCKNVRFYLHY